MRQICEWFHKTKQNSKTRPISKRHTITFSDTTSHIEFLDIHFQKIKAS